MQHGRCGAAHHERRLLDDTARGDSEGVLQPRRVASGGGPVGHHVCVVAFRGASGPTNLSLDFALDRLGAARTRGPEGSVRGRRPVPVPRQHRTPVRHTYTEIERIGAHKAWRIRCGVPIRKPTMNFTVGWFSERTLERSQDLGARGWYRLRSDTEELTLALRCGILDPVK